MKVWVVMENDDEGIFDMAGVFSSRKKAEDFVEIEKSYSEKNRPYIVSWEVE